MTLSELIAAYGNDKVHAQYLDQCVRTMNYDRKKGTTITFGTTMNIYADEGTEKLGIVVWLDRDRVAEIIKQSKSGGASMSSHTPGKWGYEDPMGPDILTIVANPDAPVYDWIWVAQISTEPVVDDDGKVRDNRSFEEHEANARLLAAAPTLYELAEDALPILDAVLEDREATIGEDEILRDLIARFRAAISSASEPRP